VQAGRGGGHLFAKLAIGLDTGAIEQMFFALGGEASYMLYRPSSPIMSVPRFITE
jgi:hypothetical protein